MFKRTYDVSREVLKSAQDYDGSGIMDELYWKQGMFHMEDLERSFFNGIAKATTDANGRRLYLTGGIRHFLLEWEKADSIYRGGSGAAAITGDTNFDKRIIANSAGTITADLLDDWGERMFNRTNSMVDSKIVITSYSIHYTKLYDPTPSLECPMSPLLSDKICKLLLRVLLVKCIFWVVQGMSL